MSRAGSGRVAFDGVVRPPIDLERETVASWLEARWGPVVVSPSGVHLLAGLDALVAVDGARVVGAATYRLDERGCEVVTLDSAEEGRGIGSALLAELKALGERHGGRTWLVTTNENLRALAFYQRRGMDLVALHRDFSSVVRHHKPGLGPVVVDGIEFRHALELSF